MKNILNFINKYKLFFIIIGVIALVASITLIILGRKDNKPTVFEYNENTTPGNTTGNLYNGGLFCEYDGKIYFGNFNDSGSLYTMDTDLKNFKKINSDNVRYINVDENHIYYSRINVSDSSPTSGSLLFSFNPTGLYRCSHTGEKLVAIYDNFTGLLSQYGNHIFYQHYTNTEGTMLYKVNIDGKNEIRMSENAILPGPYQANFMYYSEMDNQHFIYVYNITTSTSDIFLEKRSMFPIISGEYLYYISIDDDYTIFRIPLSGGKEEQVISDRCSTYNFSIGGKYLYYQTDASSNNKFCKKDLETGEVTIIKEGDFTNINVTSDYVFFSESFGSNTYYLEHDACIAKQFNPETD